MPRVKTSERLDLEVSDENDWKIKNIINEFILDYKQIINLKSVMLEEMEKGLSADPKIREESSLQMSISHVCDLINGTERGIFLALDIGGTNFRILCVTLKSGNRCISHSEQYKLPDERLNGTTVQLFDYIAESLQYFINKEKLNQRKDRLFLGFTYSLPLKQTSLKSGEILKFNKNFAIKDGKGLDPVALLQEALDKRSINIEVACILNDTTGTMMCGAFQDSACAIGLIMGTGSNVCYLEKINNIPKHPDVLTASDSSYVIVNIELGAFGDNGVIQFLKSQHDLAVDEQSLHKGVYTFEKLFSGLYLGEVARVTLLRLCEEGLVFGGKPSDALKTPGGIPSSFVSRVEKDSPRDLSNTHSCLRSLNLEEISDDDYHVVRYLANTLSVRAAQIVAACLSVIVERIDRSEVVVAVDGSLYSKHKVLQSLIQEFVEKYCKERHVRLLTVNDGSGKGAAFVAAVVKRQKEEAENGEVCGSILRDS